MDKPLMNEDELVKEIADMLKMDMEPKYIDISHLDTAKIIVSYIGYYKDKVEWT